MEFKRWSETNPKVMKELRPDFGYKAWGEIARDVKFDIWQHFKDHFFNHITTKQRHQLIFSGDPAERMVKEEFIKSSVAELSRSYRAKNYASNYLADPSLDSACEDFNYVFIYGSEAVALELLSIYCEQLIQGRRADPIGRAYAETDEMYENRKAKHLYGRFDNFAKDLNDIFEQYGVNMLLTRSGFIPRQDQRIIEDIYAPVLAMLTKEKWEPVNNLLVDAFKEYRQGTQQGYSVCVTHTVAAVQAYLQILVTGKVGAGDISKLIGQAQGAKLLSDDAITTTLLKNIQSILMQERQETGVAHPKEGYATQKNARGLLNVAMIFLQHCGQE